MGALQFHALNVANWQRTEDGHKGTNKPEPLLPPRPAHEREAEETAIAAKARAFRNRQARKQSEN